MKPDLSLIDEVMQCVTEMNSNNPVHLVSCLIGVYRSALIEYEETREERYYDMARDAEKALKAICDQYHTMRDIPLGANLGGSSRSAVVGRTISPR